MQCRQEAVQHTRRHEEGFGGAGGDRTPDLRIANATLSHLSYGPSKGAILACTSATRQWGRRIRLRLFRSPAVARD